MESGVSEMKKCKICKKTLSKNIYTYCSNCYHTLLKGKNNPNYKDGNTIKLGNNYNKNNRCVDCGKLVSNQSKDRCKKCANKGRRNPGYNNGKSCEPTNCIECGKLTTRHSKKCKRCANKNKFLGYKHTQQSKNKMSKAICRHHIDMNQKNNKNSNILLLNKANHQKIHRFMYDYIVKIKKDYITLKTYINWFKKNYPEIKNRR